MVKDVKGAGSDKIGILEGNEEYYSEAELIEWAPHRGTSIFRIREPVVVHQGKSFTKREAFC